MAVQAQTPVLTALAVIHVSNARCMDFSKVIFVIECT